MTNNRREERKLLFNVRLDFTVTFEVWSFVVAVHRGLETSRFAVYAWYKTTFQYELYKNHLLNTFEWNLIKAFEYSLEHKWIRTTLLYSDERKYYRFVYYRVLKRCTMRSATTTQWWLINTRLQNISSRKLLEINLDMK